ncbi:hypothetical protein [Actinophytocola gossypii]|uniref:WXG100 family type VII secretion target n=1 Tax=Actinophytocola gossypii TaxID=2812003 RepID=A0ABT2J3F5_9PSEU|nr:hypothetical protein [Actinophytocola gossypii]MCT2582377.1 hypothetical protein [Actinophytocola gossypii]
MASLAVTCSPSPIEGGYEGELMADFTVELSDLRGWADQVERGSGDLEAAHGYATSNIADADFGRILELITDDYQALLTAFHTVLQADAAGLDRAMSALDASADTYQAADDRSRNRLTEIDGQTADITDDGAANGFTDQAAAAAKLTPPTDGGETLPEVSFGWILDKVCELVVWVGGPDPREYVTQWIAGDVAKASRQVSAWEHVADCVDAVDVNLDSGRAAITRTWTGAASTASASHMDLWSTCLTEQSSAMRQVAAHLRDAVDQAVKMAQVVVDIIKTVISLVSAALSNAAIPAYGQWKLIKTVKRRSP